MGHGARGLQRGRRTPGTTSPTTSRAPGPTAGAKTASAGISDDQQRLCFALALWNERDPILKERLFGLTNSEGNHGEDVKEYYFYLDSTPTHSYMKYLYKYPQREFPYRDLVETNRRRTREELEYELLDTGVFDDDRYFDVFLEYAKEGPDDLLIRVTVHNRGPRGGPAAAVPDAVVPQHLVVGRRGGEASPARGRRDDRGLPPRAGRVHPGLRRRAGAAVHRERDQLREAVAPAEPEPVRQGRLPPLRDLRRPGCGEPRPDRDEGRGALRPRGAGGRLPGRPAAPGQGHDSPQDRSGLRRHAAAAAGRRRRVLRPDHAPLARRGRAPGPPPGAGRHAVDQAVLLLRPRPLAQGAPGPPAHGRRRPRGAQRRVVPHAERRRDLHARQVGVPLVRRLGPGLPHDRAVAGRLRLRQGAAAADAAQPLRPPQRADPRLRVELQRRQPAGPRLGDPLPLQVREEPGPRGPQVPGALVPGPDAQLQLVGEPQGPAGEERLRRRFPGPRQHRRLRPQRAAAHRRLPRAGGRHGLDGLLLRRTCSRWP